MSYEEINSLFEELAKKLSTMIPVEWSRIQFYSAITEFSNSIYYSFFTKNGDFKESYMLIHEFGMDEDENDKHIFELSDLTWRIRDAFKEIPHEPWNIITVIVQDTGKYTVDFDYHLSEILDDREWWEEKYLPECKEQIAAQAALNAAKLREQNQMISPDKNFFAFHRVDELNLVLVRKLLSMLPFEWSKLAFYGEFAEDGNRIHYVFYPTSDNLPREPMALVDEFAMTEDEKDRLSSEISQILDDLFAALEDVPHDPWNTLNVFIDQTKPDEEDSYVMTFEDRDFVRLSEMQRREAWAQKYLDPDKDPIGDVKHDILQERIDGIFRSLAAKMAQTVPVECGKILLHCELMEDSIVLRRCFYPVSDNLLRQSRDLIDEFGLTVEEERRQAEELSEIVEELADAFEELQSEAWNIITVILEKDGEFNVDFEYVDFDEISADERKKRWVDKYL